MNEAFEKWFEQHHPGYHEALTTDDYVIQDWYNEARVQKQRFKAAFLAGHALKKDATS
jgi:hypothetical protein